MQFIVNNWMLELIILISGAMLVWPLLAGRFSKMKDVGTLAATQLVNRQNAVLLDVRDAKEYAGGHLPNAVHIPLSELGTRGAELGKLVSRPVIAYCERGQRSRAAGALLARHGFADIYQLTGGYRAWKDAGLPVEK